MTQALFVLFCVLWGGSLSLAAVPTHKVIRATGKIKIDGKLDEPSWGKTKTLPKFVFPWWKSGLKEQTTVRVLYDDRYLYVSYRCDDAHISARRTKRDSQVYLDDCVEIFIAPNPQTPLNYFNFEMNARGALLDQHHPKGPGPTKREWNSKGVRIAVTRVGTLNKDDDRDRQWTLEAAIPWSNFRGVAKSIPPARGDVWHVNLNRCGGVTNQQYSQWSASQTKAPQFHAPKDFGRFSFVGKPKAATEKRKLGGLLKKLFRR